MSTRTRQVNVRLTEKEMRLLSALRRRREPIPGASAVVREALHRLNEHDHQSKRNGHGGRRSNGSSE